jgi:hypothetical protein
VGLHAPTSCKGNDQDPDPARRRPEYALNLAQKICFSKIFLSIRWLSWQIKWLFGSRGPSNGTGPMMFVKNSRLVGAEGELQAERENLAL